MTRRSERELEDDVDRLERAFAPVAGYEPETLTDEERERLRSLFRDVEDLTEAEREHYENIQTWVDETDVVVSGELTPAGSALFDLMLATGESPATFPKQYYERFPDAPGGVS